MSDDYRARLTFDGPRVDTTTSQLAALARSYGRPSADELPADLGPDDLYPVPPSHRFRDRSERPIQYIDAPDLEVVARDVVERWPEMGHLEDVRVLWRWKDKGTPAAMGKCTRVSALYASALEADYIIWLGAEDVRDAYYTRLQVEALVYHELCHIEIDEETGKTGTARHDAELFFAELARYGVWRRDYQRFGQMALDGILSRGPGLMELPYGECPSCSAVVKLADGCPSCSRLEDAPPAAMAACERCGVVVEPEEASTPAYRLGRMCAECREGEDVRS